MGVGLRLKDILRNKGMTIKQLSEITGISLNTLYSITKRDSERIDTVLLRRIARALDISEDELIGMKPLPKKGEYGTDALQTKLAVRRFIRAMGFDYYGDLPLEDDDQNILSEKLSDWRFEDTRSNVVYRVSLNDIEEIEAKVVSFLKFTISEYESTWHKVPTDDK